VSHTSGMDTQGRGPDMEVHRTPSEEFSFMHSGAIGNEVTHDAMPQFFGTSHRILLPLIFLICIMLIHIFYKVQS
jgi:hypothetical protein